MSVDIKYPTREELESEKSRLEGELEFLRTHDEWTITSQLHSIRFLLGEDDW